MFYKYARDYYISDETDVDCSQAEQIHIIEKKPNVRGAKEVKYLKHGNTYYLFNSTISKDTNFSKKILIIQSDFQFVDFVIDRVKELWFYNKHSFKPNIKKTRVLSLEFYDQKIIDKYEYKNVYIRKKAKNIKIKKQISEFQLHRKSKIKKLKIMANHCYIDGKIKDYSYFIDDYSFNKYIAHLYINA